MLLAIYYCSSILYQLSELAQGLMLPKDMNTEQLSSEI